MAIDLPTSRATRWRAVARVLRSPLDAISCALFPSPCTLCGTFLPRLSLVPICEFCWAAMPVTSGPVCTCCGSVLQFGTARLCRACRLAPPPFVKAVSYGPYEGALRDAIHRLKYTRIRGLNRGLGRLLANAIAQLAGEAPAELLVIPVPLHSGKYQLRGFNQARTLAAQALRCLRQSHPNWQLTLAARTLMRLRATKNQAGLSPRMRRQNLRGAFAVSDPSAVAGRHVLLVDDIMTTGATARAAALALRRSGAASVWVATLSRAQVRFPQRGEAIIADLGLDAWMPQELQTPLPAETEPVQDQF